jgi:hypothetical protein
MDGVKLPQESSGREDAPSPEKSSNNETAAAGTVKCLKCTKAAKKGDQSRSVCIGGLDPSVPSPIHSLMCQQDVLTVSASNAVLMRHVKFTRNNGKRLCTGKRS